MSQENVEVMQRAFGHFVRTGEPKWDTIDPNVEVHDHDIPDASIYRGHEGYAQWLVNWGEAWADFSMEVQRWIDAGDTVVCVFELTAKGKESGLELKRRDAMVLTIQAGLCVRLDYFNNEAEARAAAGLAD
jgi:ketosteroid isomerase-like protein